jgi:hypothetical protein
VIFPRKSRHRVVRISPLLRGNVADGAVDLLTIVVAFNIDEQVALRGVAIGVFVLMDELGLQRAEEVLHRA